ncbi:hypothetical protein Pint_17541 [Pistacia integerrima]|uniref:Uncharacterized protein n=1 Tax=Pistacia integerrima TaxID=434235 RepID=A0ACC0YYU4_9ROSI|nr:hypothetical protein Pint_17541 [Pistacia integerrima]
MNQNRQVSIEEGDGKARESGVMFIETSAKTGFKIKPPISQDGGCIARNGDPFFHKTRRHGGCQPKADC